jgi:hypothetical protein
MFNLKFQDDQRTKQVTVQAMHGETVVATGLVFMGDTPQEQHCAFSVQRPHLLEERMVTALRDALTGVVGDRARVERAIPRMRVATA